MNSITSVYIKDMRMYAYHGVLDQERIVGNDYVINISVDYPWQKAAATDDVSDTLNYASLADIIKTEMSLPSNLLEHVAMRIVNAVKAAFPQTVGVSVDIRKQSPPMAYDTDGCGVCLNVTF